MRTDYAEVWERCLGTIRSNVNEQSFKTWFVPIRPVKLDDNVLTLQVPNKFFYEWLEEHFISVLRQSIRQELGSKARLEYQMRVGQESAQNKSDSTLTNGAASNGNGSNGHDQPVEPANYVMSPEIRNPFVIPGIKKVAVETNLNRNYTFENYVEGDCNRLARSAGEAVSKNPGRTAFNPLFIFGSVGLGKTHLAQAIGNHIVETGQGESVRYATSEKFTNDIIYSIKNNAVGDLVNFYQNIDVLIVDDIQFLANRTKTQEIFFHIFNQLHQSGKQIVLTSDRAPKDLPGIEERLISRFKWGLSADLQTPDFETRIVILENKLSEAGVDVPREVVEYICFNIQSNIRELEGVATSIIAHTSLAQRDVDLALAQEVIQGFIRNASKEITIEKIKKIVSDYFEIPVDRLRSKTRKREVVMARQISMYMAKELTGQSLKSIGESFGGRDHSTVIYSCRAVRDLMDTDSQYREAVSDLEKQINMSMAG